MSAATLATATADAADLEHDAPHQKHFASAKDQHAASLLGMWVFLANELMLFSGLFVTASVLTAMYPEAVRAASRALTWWLAGLNTVVLITSSLAMSVAIERARAGRQDAIRRPLLVAGALGALFLAIKAVEYAKDYEDGLMPFLGSPMALPDPASVLFLNLYYVATALHAVHLTIGIVLVAVLWSRAGNPGFLPPKIMHVETAGLYWHFVDLVWVVLFATLYLATR